jgi:hypothetical protein
MQTATRPAGYAGREVTHPPDWHGLVVWDFFFNALTTGLFMVAAVGELARPDLFATVGTWAYPFALGFLLLDLAPRSSTWATRSGSATCSGCSSRRPRCPSGRGA